MSSTEPGIVPSNNINDNTVIFCVPEMMDYNKRLDSFRGHWPKNKSQTPKDLAAAGLFFTGERDLTKCFCCGGYLERWDSTDDPWSEHARWFPSCEHVLSHQRETSASSSTEIEDEELRIIQVVLGKDVKKQPFVEQALRERRNGPGPVRFVSVEELEHATMTIERRPKVSDMAENNACAEVGAREHPQLARTSSDYEQLVMENERLKTERLCKVCLDGLSSISFQPCGHCVSCLKCSHQLTSCPVCRSNITRRDRIFLA